MKTISERFMYYAGILAAAGANVDDLKHISDLLDLEEQGLLVKAPVPFKTEVYKIEGKRVVAIEAFGFRLEKDGLYACNAFGFEIGKWNEKVFATKEKALEEMEKWI